MHVLDSPFGPRRKPPAKTWEIHEDPRVSPELAYRRIAGEIDLMEPVRSGTVPLMSMADVATTLVNPLCLRVTQLERFTENGRRYIRLGFEDCPPGHPTYRKITLRVAADDFSVTHEESVGKADDTWQDERSINRARACRSCSPRGASGGGPTTLVRPTSSRW